MQKKILFLFVYFSAMLLGVQSLFGQQQIENPGFEFWEEVGFGPDTLEPVEWSSLKTSDGGEFINDAIPVVWEQSIDAHSGMYSIKLINMPILTLVAPGTLTNGRVHAAVPPTNAYVYTVKEDPQWNTAFTDTPDSLVVWAKFMPEGNDMAHAVAILHTDTAKVFDSTMFNWVAVASIDFAGQISEWTRFSVPFTYLNGNETEYILLAVFAGDGVNALAGSILYLDDFELIYNSSSVASQSETIPKIYFSNNKLVIHPADNSFNRSKIKLIDLTGHTLLSREIDSGHKTTISADLPSGMYFCRYTNAGNDFTVKLIKN